MSDPRAPKVQRFISVYQALGGWKWVEMWWNPDLGGFWEPYDNGKHFYTTAGAAAREGREIAAASGKPFIWIGEAWPKPEQYDA